jgi:hypothetical protein
MGNLPIFQTGPPLPAGQRHLLSRAGQLFAATC